MSPTLFSYAWEHSRRQQVVLLVLTLATLPVLYLSLEAPKQIVNEAIGGEGFPIESFLGALSQLEYLALWCAIFLLAVIVSGLMKMQLNLMRGVLAERLLRRLRFTLIERIHRFPLAHFRRTSQGELISMVTAEAEPLGGIMGNMIAQPLFLAGQMLTILLFLLIQNVWLALAAVALIPVQAYVIPLIQRRVNQLNKQRVIQVRGLAETMGESVAGMEDLRANNLLRYRLAQLSHQLSSIFSIRYQIYRLKFFMKFLNNFLNQLTPFFFFAIGGWLVIAGDLSLGALVAALSAFKDLSGPWKELLTFYNQYQDMSLRYKTVIERFEPQGMFDETLYRPGASVAPLEGPIRFENVSIGDGDGAATLSNLNLEIPKGALIGVESADAVERTALVNALSRGVSPRAGRIMIGEKDLADLPQDAVGQRIGAVSDQPYLFTGPIGRNLTAALMAAPLRPASWPDAERAQAESAALDGASPDPFAVDWLDPGLAGVETRMELRQWWLQIVEAMEADSFLVDRALTAKVDPATNEDLAQRTVELRPSIKQRLAEEELTYSVIAFDPEAYHPGLTVVENLLFAIPNTPIDLAQMMRDPEIQQIGQILEDAAPLREIALDQLDTLMRVFDGVDTEHPLFQRLGLAPTEYQLLVDWRRGRSTDPDIDPELLLRLLPFKIPEEMLPEAFTAAFRKKILEVRQARGAELLETVRDRFTPLAAETYAPGLTLLENAIFGTIARGAVDCLERVSNSTRDVMIAEGLKAEMAVTIASVDSGIGGAALPPVARERIALVRAVVKKPDILVLNRLLSNHAQEQRERTIRRLRELLPKATIVILEAHISDTDAYDQIFQIKGGELSGASPAPAETAGSAMADLDKKIRILRMSPLAEGLDRSHVRLLAFASDWVKAKAGQKFFRAGDQTDGAYLLVKGRAQLRWDNSAPEDPPVTNVDPGRIVGDLSVILGTPRNMDLLALEDSVALRIRSEELLQIVESDAHVATTLLKTVAGYLVDVAAVRARVADAAKEGDIDAVRRIAKGENQ